MNKDMEELEKKIIDLEIKFTQQDDLIDQLNKLVTKHEFTIDQLVKELTELKLNSGNDKGDVPNERPPHY